MFCFVSNDDAFFHSLYLERHFEHLTIKLNEATLFSGGVIKLATPAGHDKKLLQCFLTLFSSFFPQFYFIFLLILDLRGDELPIWEGPGHATGFPSFYCYLSEDFTLTPWAVNCQVKHMTFIYYYQFHAVVYVGFFTGQE